jgi:hypothetical protein
MRRELVLDSGVAQTDDQLHALSMSSCRNRCVG